MKTEWIEWCSLATLVLLDMVVILAYLKLLSSP